MSGCDDASTSSPAAATLDPLLRCTGFGIHLRPRCFDGGKAVAEAPIAVEIAATAGAAAATAAQAAAAALPGVPQEKVFSAQWHSLVSRSDPRVQ